MSSKNKKKQTNVQKYFSTTKKGEVAELKKRLNSLNKDEVKEAVKKVIASMTVGKDVSSLFTDVVKSMQTNDLELKKLIYLYIINYARSQPDKAFLVVNTFMKDAKDRSSLVRALAIRTMGCIRVDNITEYLTEPLKAALKDENPYVRKTAAVCTAKLYDINAEMVEEQDFVEILRGLISDPNPMVVANAVAALAEISETSKKDVLQINSSMLSKLLAALNECTEWGQVTILDMLAKYEPSARDAESIIERVTPRLQHANSAVALSAVKVILKYMDRIDNANMKQQLIKTKLPPPLITLLSGTPPEIQYVALRNINLVVQKCPKILENEVKRFFCKYNDPLYVKMEKLELLIRLVTNENVEQVLMELREYAAEVDVEFVRKTIRAIGRCAIKLERTAKRCVQVLLELIQTNVNYVVQESIIVIKDIFRKYPNKYESVISKLCEHLEALDEPEAKASMIWIIGEYAGRIDNAPELLEDFLETFNDETGFVQLQLLTAIVKLFLRRPDDGQDMVTKVLNYATESVHNPDLRDRGYVYWRLLSTDPKAAESVVFASKPGVTDDTNKLNSKVLNALISDLASLASIYHLPPQHFIKDGGKSITFKSKENGRDQDSASSSDESDSESSESSDDEDEKSDVDENNKKQETSTNSLDILSSPSNNSTSNNNQLDLLGDIFGTPTTTPTNNNNNNNNNNNIIATDEPKSRPLKVTCPSDNPKVPGLEVSSACNRRNGRVYLDLKFNNQTGKDLNNFAVKINVNFFGVQPDGPLKPGLIANGSQGKASLPLIASQGVNRQVKPGLLQVAIKTDAGVVFLSDVLPTYLLFEDDGNVGRKQFLDLWKSFGDDEATLDFPKATTNTIDGIKEVCESNRIFEIAKRTVAGRGEVLYASLKLLNEWVLLEITVNGSSVNGCAKASNELLSKASLFAIRNLLR